VRVLSTLLIAAATSCSAPSSSDTTTFVAFADDFAPYESWTSFDVGEIPDPNGVDLAGPRTVYVNRLPPHGATEFPVGTILVKVVRTDDVPQDWQMFALVKRGGGYDGDGAPNWEWFGLSTDASGHVVIDWRGTGPPPDGGYGSIGGALSCVLCHAAARGNDYVQTPELQLSSF
jgi:hypothetical protein